MWSSTQGIGVPHLLKSDSFVLDEKKLDESDKEDVTLH